MSILLFLVVFGSIIVGIASVIMCIDIIKKYGSIIGLSDINLDVSYSTLVLDVYNPDVLKFDNDLIVGLIKDDGFFLKYYILKPTGSGCNLSYTVLRYSTLCFAIDDLFKSAKINTMNKLSGVGYDTNLNFNKVSVFSNKINISNSVEKELL